MSKDLAEMDKIELLALNGGFYPAGNTLKLLRAKEIVKSKSAIIIVDEQGQEKKETKALGTVISYGSLSSPFEIGDIVEHGKHSGYVPQGEAPEGYEFYIIRYSDVTQHKMSITDYLKKIESKKGEE